MSSSFGSSCWPRSASNRKSYWRFLLVRELPCSLTRINGDRWIRVGIQVLSLLFHYFSQFAVAAQILNGTSIALGLLLGVGLGWSVSICPNHPSRLLRAAEGSCIERLKKGSSRSRRCLAKRMCLALMHSMKLTNQPRFCKIYHQTH